MAVSKAQWNLAFELLGRFERQLIGPELFKWDYFIEQVSCSKPTLWRNKLFKEEFQRVQRLVREYKGKNIEYSIERSKMSQKDQEIQKLKDRIKVLEDERDRERERLVYASMVARRRNIDPEEFTERSPLRKANEKRKNDSLDLNDPLIAKIRGQHK